MTRTKWSRILAAVAPIAGLALALATAPAHATAILTVTDGTNTWTTTGDGSSVLSLSATNGSWWVGGVTAPDSGSVYDPDMHLTAFGSGIGDLTITFSDTGFSGTGPIDFLTSIGGALGFGGTVSLDSSSTLGDLSALGPYSGTGSFSDGSLVSQDLTGSYGLTLTANLTQSGGSASSFDASLTEVPEPGTLALFGVGLLGCIVAIRRRRTSVQAITA